MQLVAIGFLIAGKAGDHILPITTVPGGTGTTQITVNSIYRFHTLVKLVPVGFPPGTLGAAPGYRYENVPTFFECGPRSLLVETRA